MSLNPISFRLPFELDEEKIGPEAAQALRYLFSGNVDLNQAIAALKQQLTGTQTTVKTITESASTTSSGVTSFNTHAGNVTFFPQLGMVNDQLGNPAYLTQTTDNGAKIIVGDSTAVVVTLNSGVPVPWFTIIDNDSSASVFLVPGSGKLHGPSIITDSSFGIVFFDGTDFWAGVSAPSSGSGGGSGITQLTGSVLAGPGTGSQSATLANTTVAPGSYTNTNLTVAADGRLTAAATGSGGSYPGTGACTAASSTAGAAVNLTTEGVFDWFCSNGLTALPRQVNPGTNGASLHAKVNGLSGGMIYNSFEWVSAGHAATIFTQAFSTITGTSTGTDDLNNTALSTTSAGQGIFSATSSVLGYGFRLTVPASTISRTLKIYASTFSGTVTLTATASDGSFTPPTATLVASAATLQEGFFTVTYNTAHDGAMVTITVLLTTNLGTSPNVKFFAATLA